MIVVVSDARLIREAISAHLERHRLGPVSAGSAETVGALVQTTEAPRVAIVDVHRVEPAGAGMNPADVIAVLRGRWPTATIVALGTPTELAAQANDANVWFSMNTVNLHDLARVAAAVLRKPQSLATPNPLRDGADHRWLSLSQRERQVLALIGAAHHNAAIAAALAISERTVKAHVSSLLKKLGVDSRTELAIAARDAGFVTIRP